MFSLDYIIEELKYKLLPKFICYLFIHSLARRPSNSLGLLNYGRPLFPIDCLLSSSPIHASLHLPAISN
jgi:hypothetical protein